jgi:glycerophosphoryl diester phosphodiesterase
MPRRRAWNRSPPHTAGLPINAWTIDDRPELERLAGLGIDMFCNDPAHAIEILSTAT